MGFWKPKRYIFITYLLILIEYGTDILDCTGSIINFIHILLVISATKENPAGIKNLEIWEVKSGNLVTSFAQKKLDTWYLFPMCHRIQYISILTCTETLLKQT
jgi:hypothetical protein